MSGPSVLALELLLVEVEATAAVILKQPDVMAALDAGVTAWALECCGRIRDALTTGDAAGAAYSGIQLGERLAELRNLGAIARRDAACKSPADRAHARDVERRKAFLAARNRGFSTTDAYEKAAATLGVSPKTIMRAVNGH
jgi:hypothetical protein